MELFKNKVGRPSNATIRKRSMTKITLTAIVASTVGCLAYTAFMLANVSLPTIGNTVIKPTNYKTVYTKSGTYYRRGATGQALQGATIASGQIYYVTTIAGAKKRTNYYSKIRMLGLYNESAIGHFNPVISASRKMNDATTRNGRNYYIAYSPSGYNTYIYYSNLNKPRYVELVAPDKHRAFANIAYNESDGKFYSLSGGKKGHIVYNYNIVDGTNDSYKQSTITATRVCKFYKNPGHTVDANTISNQSIAIYNNKLYQAYVVHPNGQKNIYRNYVAVYNLSNCTNNNTVYPEYTYKVGSCNSYSNQTNCEIESLFFMNGKLVLGYNNNKFNTSYFYTMSL